MYDKEMIEAHQSSMLKFIKRNYKRVADLVRETGIAQSTLNSLMSNPLNNPRILTVRKIADAKKVSIDEVIGRNAVARPTKPLNSQLLKLILNAVFFDKEGEGDGQLNEKKLEVAISAYESFQGEPKTTKHDIEIYMKAYKMFIKNSSPR